MDHLAIMKQSLGLLEKIIDGSKKIESRWYKTRKAPWNRIKKGDTVYFMDACKPVVAYSNVKDVLQFENLTKNTIKEIIDIYSNQIGINDKINFFKTVKDKRYCIIVFLDGITKVEPFYINKKGYGMSSAWLSLDSIEKIRKS